MRRPFALSGSSTTLEGSTQEEGDVAEEKHLDRKKFLGVAAAGAATAGGLGFAGYARAAGRPQTAAAIRAARPYLIGCPFPLHSFYAADGNQMKNGSGLAIDEINGSGGIAGRQIRRIVIDADVASPEGVTTAFKKLVSSRVDAILVGYIQVDAPSYDIAAAYGAPYIHGNTLDAGVQRVKANPTKYFNIFNVDSTEVHYGLNFPQFISRLSRTGQFRPRAKTIQFIEGDLGYSQNISRAGQAAFRKAGWRILGVEKVVTPTNDWGPTIRKLNKGAAVIMNCHPAPADLAQFMKQFAASPVNALVYLQYGPSVPQFLQLAGSSANGAIWSTVVGTFNDPLGKAFQAKYRAKYKSDPGFANAGQCYDEVYMLASAWGKVGDPRNFRAVARALRTTIHRGVSGTINMNRPGQYSLSYPFETDDPSIGMAHLYFQIQNGKQRIIFPSPYSEARYQKAPWQK
jgi:branched-chain amino acid transport system substrate-binding protein